jgi:NTP pyrophosphatase (non-canonical NTP hydrolase)
MALTPNKYQREAWKTASFKDGVDIFMDRTPDEQREFLRLLYATVKLNGEAGEFAEEVGKSLRDTGGDINPRREKMLDELGDVLWYVAALCTILNVSLEDIMEKNLGKVRKKYKAGQREKYGIAEGD